jgi:hypothetical protein
MFSFELTRPTKAAWLRFFRDLACLRLAGSGLALTNTSKMVRQRKARPLLYTSVNMLFRTEIQMTAIGVRRAKAAFPSGSETARVIDPAGSTWNGNFCRFSPYPNDADGAWLTT